MLTSGAGRAGSDQFDRSQPFRIERRAERVLLPTPALRAGACAHWLPTPVRGLVVLDPALPLGMLGRLLGVPYALVLHGAEVTVPGRLPGTAQLLSSVIGARH